MRAEHLLQYILPLLGAGIGILVFLLGIRDNWAKIRGGDALPILVILISLLCTAYGVERLTYSTEIDQIRQRLDKVPAASFLSTRPEIWSSIRRLMLGVDQTVRAVEAADRPTDVPQQYENLPDEFRTRLASQKGQLGGAVKYRVVLVFEYPKHSDGLATIEQAIEQKMDAYKKAGLEDVLELRVFEREPLAKFDVTIIDTQHVIIGFDTAQGKSMTNVEIQNVMIWENQPAMAQKFASWFDNTVWPKAKPYREWLIEQKKS
jgi:hypothetical protein